MAAYLQSMEDILKLLPFLSSYPVLAGVVSNIMKLQMEASDPSPTGLLEVRQFQGRPFAGVHQ
ncbi:hypothetical protein CRG98_044862, partial [Punica granatum]